jgi:hypothetical protein
MRPCLTLAAAAVLLSATADFTLAADPKKAAAQADPIQLKIVANQANYVWDADGKTPAEFRKMMDDLSEQLKKKPAPNVNVPKAPAVNLTLQIINTGKEDVTVYVGGDPNTYTLELKGPGVVTLSPLLAFTADFRVPKAVTLAPGKSYDINLKHLTDGFRGASRFVYWTDVGDYTLSATYQLSDAQGKKLGVLKSEPVKLKVELKK